MIYVLLVRCLFHFNHLDANNLTISDDTDDDDDERPTYTTLTPCLPDEIQPLGKRFQELLF